MYNYVIWGITDNYYRTVFREIENDENVRLMGDIKPLRGGFSYKLWKLHNSGKINRLIKLPFKSMWYKTYFKNNFKDDNPICFVFSGGYYKWTEYFDFLKKAYTGCKIVFTIRDTIKLYSTYEGFDIERLKRKCDAVMSYNKFDCEKYGMYFFYSEASYLPVKKAADYPLSDLFFAGLAKDRMDSIMRIYDECEKKNIRCDFFILRAPRKQQIRKPGIEYADKGMPYEEMLYRTANCRCVLEISQKNVYGFTSRAFEAIMYNKKLVTDSIIVKDQKFMKTGFIQYFGDIADIDYDFIKKDVGDIDYRYNGEYSPRITLQNIDDAIKQNNGGEKND